MAGSRISPARGFQKAREPVRRPARKAIKNPRLMRPKENQRAPQEAGEASCTARAFKASRGPTRRIWFWTARDARCHKNSQNSRMAVLRDQSGNLCMEVSAPLHIEPEAPARSFSWKRLPYSRRRHPAGLRLWRQGSGQRGPLNSRTEPFSSHRT